MYRKLMLATRNIGNLGAKDRVRLKTNSIFVKGIHAGM